MSIKEQKGAREKGALQLQLQTTQVTQDLNLLVLGKIIDPSSMRSTVWSISRVLRLELWGIKRDEEQKGERSKGALLVSGKVGAHTRDTETDRQLR